MYDLVGRRAITRVSSLLRIASHCNAFTVYARFPTVAVSLRPRKPRSRASPTMSTSMNFRCGGKRHCTPLLFLPNSLHKGKGVLFASTQLAPFYSGRSLGEQCISSTLRFKTGFLNARSEKPLRTEVDPTSILSWCREENQILINNNNKVGRNKKKWKKIINRAIIH